MRAVDDGPDAPRASHPADLPHRKDLPGEVRDVAKMDDLRLRRDGTLEHIHEELHAGRRRRERHRLDHDPLATAPLIPGREHAAVVLIGRENLVPRRKVEPELHVLE
jgi:hypothetical protein